MARFCVLSPHFECTDVHFVLVCPLKRLFNLKTLQGMSVVINITLREMEICTQEVSFSLYLFYSGSLRLMPVIKDTRS